MVGTGGLLRGTSSTYRQTDRRADRRRPGGFLRCVGDDPRPTHTQGGGERGVGEGRGAGGVFHRRAGIGTNGPAAARIPRSAPPRCAACNAVVLRPPPRDRCRVYASALRPTARALLRSVLGPPFAPFRPRRARCDAVRGKMRTCYQCTLVPHSRSREIRILGRNPAS